jgi:bifunctional non-homologous end joining protein LigD
MLWRITPARSRLTPAGFIRPARPLLTTTPRAGPEWVHEIKHDGYRLIARKDAGRVTLWNRYATDYSDTFSRIAEAVRALPVDRVMIDGEAVVFRSDGHSDFTALRTNRGASEASLVTFDLLQFDGEDWRKLPLEIRRARLESCVSGINGLTFSEAIEGDGALVFDHACKLGLEGIVSKRLGGAYSSGRCRNWLRVKNPAFQRRWPAGRRRPWGALTPLATAASKDQ